MEVIMQNVFVVYALHYLEYGVDDGKSLWQEVWLVICPPMNADKPFGRRGCVICCASLEPRGQVPAIPILENKLRLIFILV